jgi:hypothetical protein
MGLLATVGHEEVHPGAPNPRLSFSLSGPPKFLRLRHQKLLKLPDMRRQPLISSRCGKRREGSQTYVELRWIPFRSASLEHISPLRELISRGIDRSKVQCDCSKLSRLRHNIAPLEVSHVLQSCLKINKLEEPSGMIKCHWFIECSSEFERQLVGMDHEISKSFPLLSLLVISTDPIVATHPFLIAYLCRAKFNRASRRNYPTAFRRRKTGLHRRRLVSTMLFMFDRSSPFDLFQQIVLKLTTREFRVAFAQFPFMATFRATTLFL